MPMPLRRPGSEVMALAGRAVGRNAIPSRGGIRRPTDWQSVLRCPARSFSPCSVGRCPIDYAGRCPEVGVVVGRSDLSASREGAFGLPETS